MGLPARHVDDSAMHNDPFRQLIERVRQRDAEACEVLVRDYGPVILREARMRLGASQLRSLLDSQDVCQSVLKSFLARVVKGQYQLQEPAQLIGLLVSMTRNKVVDNARRETTRRAAYRWHAAESAHAATGRMATDRESPEQMAIAHELLETYRRQLVQDEWTLFERRMEGHTWAEISAATGESAGALRKRLRRALDRVAVAAV
jgi:RNA polymerase sigma-70 factor (ECF subfamily)